MSTPRSLRLADGVRRVTISTSRGAFAALEALPVTGVREREPALLVPGYTGSKEDFLAVLAPLAAAGRRVITIDMRGQYETSPATDPDGYRMGALAADVAAVAAAVAAPRVHLLGHSFGGLVARETMITDGGTVGSLTLMSSGPGPITGPRAAALRNVLADFDRATDLPAHVRWLWDTQFGPQAVADGAAPEIVRFLRNRMLATCPVGLRTMATDLLSCPDRTADLLGTGRPMLVVYGEDDDAWHPAVQEDMAERLRAQRTCIPEAAHSPAVEAPETTAATLTSFWNTVESAQGRSSSARPSQG